MLNDALMVGIVLTLVFGSVIFFLYNRLTMTEKKMGLFEGVLTDLKIMMDAAPIASGPPPPESGHWVREFEPTPEYLNAISGPVPLEEEEVEKVEEDYQQTLDKALSGAIDTQVGEGYRTLQIDETGSVGASTAAPAINVTKLSPDLDSMTVKELNTLAKQRGLTVPAGTRRKDLIDLLKKSDTDTLDGPAPPAEGESLEGSI